MRKAKQVEPVESRESALMREELGQGEPCSERYTDRLVLLHSCSWMCFACQAVGCALLAKLCKQAQAGRLAREDAHSCFERAQGRRLQELWRKTVPVLNRSGRKSTLVLC